MPRAKPPDEPCPTLAVVEACRFRPSFSQLEPADQAALLLNCASVAGPALRECEGRRRVLMEWIGEE